MWGWGVIAGVASPILVYFSGDWNVHWGYGLLTHGHMAESRGRAVALRNLRWRRDSAGVFVHPRRLSALTM